MAEANLTVKVTADTSEFHRHIDETLRTYAEKARLVTRREWASLLLPGEPESVDEALWEACSMGISGDALAKAIRSTYMEQP